MSMLVFIYESIMIISSISYSKHEFYVDMEHIIHSTWGFGNKIKDYQIGTSMLFNLFQEDKMHVFNN